MAHHCTIMRHLVSILIASLQLKESMECTQLAFDAITNIAGRLEFSGRKRNQFTNALDEVPNDPFTRELLKLRASAAMSAATALTYSSILRTIPTIIVAMLNVKTMINRHYVVKSLELLNKLILVHENDLFFQNTPYDVMETLMMLLNVSLTRVDPIILESYLITGDPLGRSRPPFAPVISCTDGVGPFSSVGTLTFSHELVDMDIRENALEVLKVLGKLSTKNGAQLAKVNNSVQVLYNIAVLRSSGSNSIKIDSCCLKAIAVLSSMAAVPEAKSKFLTLRTEFIAAACRDNGMAGELLVI